MTRDRIEVESSYAGFGRFVGRVVYGPPDWIVAKMSSRDRRAFGFWTFVASCVGALFFGRVVLYVTVLSIVALIPNFSAETPVEIETPPENDEGPQ